MRSVQSWKRRFSQLQNELSFCGLSSAVSDAGGFFCKFLSFAETLLDVSPVKHQDIHNMLHD